MDRLGPTIAAIAREKAAIIERGDLAVTGRDAATALAVIRRRARGSACRCTMSSRRRSSAGTGTASRSSCRASGRTRVGLRGRHQAANVAVADAVLDALEAAGIAGSPARARGAATRPRAGRAAWSC